MSKKLGLSMMLVAVSVAGCGTDLGECKDPAQVGYPLLGDLNMNGVQGDVYEEYRWEGQSVVNVTCAAGKCHSGLATGEARQGVPAELDFDAPDVVYTQRELDVAAQGIANIREHADIIWEAIDDGTMPPNDANPNREAVRNWLACGAPMRQPEFMMVEGDSFEAVFASFAGCVGCHNDNVPSGGFALGADACDSYSKVMSSTGACGATYVVPGDLANSFLLQKLTATPGCGAPMPQGSVFQTTNPEDFARLQRWIMAGAPAPTTCP